MKLKNIKILSIFGIFILSFLTHYVYEIFPSFITSILFPINESVFEHMKMIFTTYMLWNIIEYRLINNKTNYKVNLIITIISNIIIFLIIFYPIYLNFEHNLVITLIIYFITIAISQIISYIILKKDNYLNLNKYFYIIIILTLIMFYLFTYYPIKNNFFIDKMNKKIGFSNIY